MDPASDEAVRIEPARASAGPPVEPDFLVDGPPPLDDPDAPTRPPADRAAAAAATAALAERIVARLNPEQARAVTTTEGPLLILAGAGSGKTRVLAHRVAYLIGVKGVRPWQILAVTFTNKAAGEMRARIVALVGEAGRDVQIGTFHAVCARVLRRDGSAIGIDPRFVIYDTDDQQTLMKQVLREEDLPSTGEFRPSAILGDQPGEERAARRGRARGGRAQPSRADRRPSRSALPGATPAVGALDFDDLLIEAVRLFEQAPGRPRPLPGSLALPARRRVPGHEPGPVPVGPGARRHATTTSPWSATTTSRSTRGAAPTCGTSSTSSATSRTRRSSSSSRTTARPSSSSTPRTRSSPATRRARTRSSGPRTRRAADPALRGLQRGGGGRVDRAPGRGADRWLALVPHPASRR